MSRKSPHMGIGLFGPTCAWKSSSGLQLAAALGGEIISCDSMQVYEGMDVGTSTPSEEERARVPHHFVSDRPIEASVDAYAFAREAEQCVQDIRGRGGCPLVVGGTGLYAKALMYRLTMFPAEKSLFRALEEILSQKGGREVLLDELARNAGENGIPDDVRLNPRRLLRAVEVLRLTGLPPWRHARKQTPRDDFVQIILLPDIAVLRPRIRKRTREMLEQGWIEETRRLLDRGLLTTPTARQALGYAEVADYLAGRVRSLDELDDIIARKTLRFARRQRTWFRHQHPGAKRIVVQRATDSQELCRIILDIVDGNDATPDEIVLT